jgi:VRR-NUC domain
MTAPGQLSMIPLSERAWQEQVTQLAGMFDWGWVHFRAARTVHGWKTPIAGPLGEGWPDLVLVRERDQRLLLVELKSDKGVLNPAQIRVHACLRAAGLDVRVWRPRDWTAVVETLR